MPHNRNGRYVATGVRQMPVMGPARPGLEPFMQPQQQAGRGRPSYCCVPTGCPRLREAPIYDSDPGDAVKTYCNNENCDQGRWMHADCFSAWEDDVLNYLRSCGRARSWSEKQRLQNLWTKKGYDLAFKACDCKCGRGHLRKDLMYVAKPANASEGDKKRRRHKSKPSSASPPLDRGSGHMMVGLQAMKAQQQQLLQQMAQHMQQQQHATQHHNRPQLRVRTSSFGSTGSMSPPSSAGTPPLTPNGSTSSSGSGGMNKKSKFDFFTTTKQAAAGNIFKRRTDYSVFNCLPRHQQNPYHIKMEDEGPHGNDETRCFVLTNLSTHQVTEVGCVVCSQSLPIYDKYPLIDGSFFLSPQRYNTDLQVLSDSKMLYLNAVCMKCLEAPMSHLRCLACKQPWYGSAFMIGSMYSYDVFAALPCCAQRLRCKNCSHAVMDPSCGFNFFSEYSKPIQCPHCRAEDYHFIKPLEEVFTYKGPIRK